MTSLQEFIEAACRATAERRDAAFPALVGTVETAQKAEHITEPFLTLKECARRLGFSYATFWKWAVPTHTLAGRPRVRIKEVELYLKSDAFKKRAAELREIDRERRAAAKRSRADEMEKRNESRVAE